jgi:tetratricopeptide (TPR) repeat protein
MSYCAEAMYKTGLGTAHADDWYPAIYHVTVASNLGAESAEVRRTLAILHFNLGACHRKAGDRDAAIERIEQAVGYDSTLLKGYNLLGALYHEKGDFARAARCYERTLTIDPGYAMARFNLGALAWAQGNYDGAAEQFAKADSLAPGNAYFVEWLTKARSRTEAP